MQWDSPSLLLLWYMLSYWQFTNTLYHILLIWTLLYALYLVNCQGCNIQKNSCGKDLYYLYPVKYCKSIYAVMSIDHRCFKSVLDCIQKLDCVKKAFYLTFQFSFPYTKKSQLIFLNFNRSCLIFWEIQTFID